MTEQIYQAIVSDLIEAGAKSPYVADANEPDPRYKGYGVRAKQKQEIVKKYRLAIRKLPLDKKIQLAQKLIHSRYGEQQTVALAILEPLADYFIPERFDLLDELVRCLHGWSKIDSYTGSLLRDILIQYPKQMIELVQRWNQDEDMWLRRASVVLFTRKVAKSGQLNDVALHLCDNLKFDSEELVLKGVGWSLKDLMKSDKPRILAVVKKMRAENVSSIVTLYAIRDIKGAERTAVLSHK